MNRPLVAFAFLALGTAAVAQCGYNLYPPRLVDASGSLLPIGAGGAAVASDENVYLAFDPLLPSGTYYVHVTDIDLSVVLSRNDPMDRFVAVTNNAGVISLSLPFSNNPDPNVFGIGLNGVGQSLRLSPLASATATPCEFKVQFGNTWNLEFGPEWPYLIQGGLIPTTGQCAIASFAMFRIGDGSGTDVTGSVFLDANRNGVRDPGEGPAVGWQVQLVTPSSTLSALTGPAGDFVFSGLGAASYSLQIVLQPGFIATTTASQALEINGCADLAANPFGVAPAVLNCNARTIGFWRNPHGLALVHQYGILNTLPALCLRNALGQHVAPANLCKYRLWLKGANSFNMAYMLSAQLVAMHNNVLVGFVDPGCVIKDPHLGSITVATLMQHAIFSLCAHGFTPPGSPHRAWQERLKNALDNANNNRNWN